MKKRFNRLLWLFPLLNLLLVGFLQWEEEIRELPTILQRIQNSTDIKSAIVQRLEEREPILSASLGQQMQILQPTVLVSTTPTAGGDSGHAPAATDQQLQPSPTPTLLLTATVALAPTVSLTPTLSLSPTVLERGVVATIVVSSTVTPSNIFATATAAQQATNSARQQQSAPPSPTVTPTPLSTFLPPGETPDATATAQQIAGEATVNAVLTSVNRPGLQVATLTSTPTPIVVTATPTAGDIFAAATQAAMVTLAATRDGTATPVPDNWRVVTPVLVYNTPTPANVATAQYVAALATANAATTGTPDPYRVTLVMTVVTATPTPDSIVAAAETLAAHHYQATVVGTATRLPPNWLVVTPIVVTHTPTPANAATAAIQANVGQAIVLLTGTPPPYAIIAMATPTPVLIAVEDPALLTNDPNWGAPKVPFPTELVGKILFVGEFNRYQGQVHKVIYAINADGTALARLTDSWAYEIAAERDSYNAEGTARVFAQRDPNDQRIQILVEDYIYGTIKPLTAFGAGVAWQPAWSPISNQVALVSSESRNDEIWVAERGVWPAIQYTQNEWQWDHHPSWSPDGSTIVFSSNRTGQDQLWMMDANGNNQRQFTDFAFEAYDPVWVKYADPYLPLVEPDDGDPRTRERSCLVCLYVRGQ